MGENKGNTEGAATPSIFSNDNEMERWKKFNKVNYEKGQCSRDTSKGRIIKDPERVEAVLRQVASKRSACFRSRHIYVDFNYCIKTYTLNYLIELGFIRPVRKVRSGWVYQRLFNPDDIDNIVREACINAE